MDAQKAPEMARKYVCQFEIKYNIVTMCSRLEMNYTIGSSVKETANNMY